MKYLLHAIVENQLSRRDFVRSLAVIGVASAGIKSLLQAANPAGGGVVADGLWVEIQDLT
jgi:hypothetical protein